MTLSHLTLQHCRHTFYFAAMHGHLIPDLLCLPSTTYDLGSKKVEGEQHWNEEAHVDNVVVLGANGEKDLTNGHARGHARGLAEGTPHASLQPIGARTREHLVDAQYVERVNLQERSHQIIVATAW